MVAVLGIDCTAIANLSNNVNSAAQQSTASGSAGSTSSYSSYSSGYLTQHNGHPNHVVGQIRGTGKSLDQQLIEELENDVMRLRNMVDHLGGLLTTRDAAYTAMVQNYTFLRYQSLANRLELFRLTPDLLEYDVCQDAWLPRANQIPGLEEACKALGVSTVTRAAATFKDSNVLSSRP